MDRLRVKRQAFLRSFTNDQTGHAMRMLIVFQRRVRLWRSLRRRCGPRQQPHTHADVTTPRHWTQPHHATHLWRPEACFHSAAAVRVADEHGAVVDLCAARAVSRVFRRHAAETRARAAALRYAEDAGGALEL